MSVYQYAGWLYAMLVVLHDMTEEDQIRAV